MTVTAFADGVWLDSDPVRILGTRLTATMTILRLKDGSLLVYSPVRMNAERCAEVEALGVVSHLYAPNLFHHMWLGDWSAAFPTARVHAPPNLEKKRPDLRIDRTHGSGVEPAFADFIEELSIDGFRLGETVLFYRPARTLIVADLVHNVGRPLDLWSKMYTRGMGFYDRVALSRVLRWTAFSDRNAARRSVDKLLALPFDHLVVGHGTPLRDRAKLAMSEALGEAC